MSEDFLQYIWKFQLFNKNDLQLTSGESIAIIRPGMQNFDSGPDFFNSQIRISKTLWAGNTEIHLKSSDWYKHQHDKDYAYSKVILHVVWEYDKAVYDNNGNQIATLELKGLIKKYLMATYRALKNNTNWLACEQSIGKVDHLVVLQNLQRKLVERLESKSQKIDHLLDINTNNWEAVLYQYLAKYFGFKTNAVPFELLANSIPYSMVQKLRFKPLVLDALFFGQGGFLDSATTEDYPTQLTDEYQFLRSKFKLSSINKSLWKFMRMRPSNFPTVRIAQFSALYHKHENLFQKTVEAKSIKELYNLFDIKTNEYWDDHFRIEQPSSLHRKKNLGIDSINSLLINGVIPILFNYSKKIDHQELQEKAFNFLETIPAEKNATIRNWNTAGIEAKSAFDSQALIQLKTMHCNAKNCLNCTIGNYILNRP